MKTYKIVSVLWEDHSSFTQRQLPDDLSNLIRPSLTMGLLFKKTKKHLVIASHIERYDHVDEADFMVIYRSSILGIKEYGKISIDNLRSEGGNT